MCICPPRSSSITTCWSLVRLVKWGVWHTSRRLYLVTVKTFPPVFVNPSLVHDISLSKVGSKVSFIPRPNVLIPMIHAQFLLLCKEVFGFTTGINSMTDLPQFFQACDCRYRMKNCNRTFFVLFLRILPKQNTALLPHVS